LHKSLKTTQCLLWSTTYIFYNGGIELVSEHLDTHVYPETENGESGNDVDSLIMMTLHQLEVCRYDKPRGKVTNFPQLQRKDKNTTLLLFVP